MPRGKRPFMVLQTKEDFDKFVHETYQSGYEDGFRSGKVNGLAHVLVGIDDQFDGEIVNDASMLTRGIKLKQWQRHDKYMKGVKALAVKEYIESTKKESEQGSETKGESA